MVGPSPDCGKQANNFCHFRLDSKLCLGVFMRKIASFQLIALNLVEAKAAKNFVI